MNKFEIQQRLEEIEKIKIEIYQRMNKEIPEDLIFSKYHFKKLVNGISVIVPTYKGEKVIKKCIESLKNQTLSPKYFEVIFIINGEKDLTEEILKNFIKEHNINHFNILHSEEASVSSARNMGIQQASKKYITFLDDDDYVSPNFLEKLFDHADEDSVVISQVVDVDLEGNINPNNPVNSQIKKALDAKIYTYTDLNSVLTMNACKLIPTKKVKTQRYELGLKSGEDVVFFTKLFALHHFHLKIVPLEDHAIYFRVLRDNSVSRRKNSFEFNVQERLEVMKHLDVLLGETNSPTIQQFIKGKIHSQYGFIDRYINNSNELREKVIEEVNKQSFVYFPYFKLYNGETRSLIISYCFPPYVDTSGTVMAKRIIENNEVVDVIYNNMSKVRDVDYRQNAMVDGFINNRMEISSASSFKQWKSMKDFIKKSLKEIKLRERKNGTYQKVYSRALWPASHFLAFEYKLKNPKVKWVAEFSDPILLDIHGNERKSAIIDLGFYKKVNALLKKKKFPLALNNNMFFWCEYLAYAFADEIVFTNENQLKYMSEMFPMQEMKEVILNKAKICNQPTLPKQYYHVKASKYRIDENKVNLGYFGTFYQTRKLNEILEGLKLTKPELRDKIKLHVFTSDPKSLANELSGEIIEKHVKVNPYVNFLEFLNFTTKFDCLVVNDAFTKGYKDINPYLPSKLSDYKGSGNNIWGIFEEGSILSRFETKYKSEIGDIEGATKVFESLVTEKLIKKFKQLDETLPNEKLI
ncbi:glycosyltransferase [Gottfriedia acidiceleris]|uniref:glycosyltransferase n=1 Tax=Gottfriedia acidiceleris TaxID=371036 RepID=UPI000B42DAC1|nr:glycosyltransferase [Gottfriedia acidiceleris]